MHGFPATHHYWRLARLLAPFPPDGVVRLPTGGTLAFNALDWTSRTAYQGLYERAEYQALRRLVRPGDSVIDVGANIGYWTLQFSYWVAEAGRVLAIEPSPHCLGRLRAAVGAAGVTNVTVVPVAVGSEERRAVLSLHDRPEHSGLGTLRPTEQAPNSLPVDVRPLSSVMSEHAFARCRLLKIDVEGLEPEVLSTIVPHIENGSIDSMLVEVSPQFGTSTSVATFLRDHMTQYIPYVFDEVRRYIRYRPTVTRTTAEQVAARPTQFNLLLVRSGLERCLSHLTA
jgi:FkbM family methyltransferase